MNAQLSTIIALWDIRQLAITWLLQVIICVLLIQFSQSVAERYCAHEVRVSMSSALAKMGHARP